VGDYYIRVSIKIRIFSWLDVNLFSRHLSIPGKTCWNPWPLVFLPCRRST